MLSIQKVGTFVNTIGFNQFEIQSSITLISIEAFAEFLTNCKAIKKEEAHQSTLILIGEAGVTRRTTESHFDVDGERIVVILHHTSYNFGIEADHENVKINLSGKETKIPKTFFSKKNLALAIPNITL